MFGGIEGANYVNALWIEQGFYRLLFIFFPSPYSKEQQKTAKNVGICILYYCAIKSSKLSAFLNKWTIDVYGMHWLETVNIKSSYLQSSDISLTDGCFEKLQ